MALRVFWTHILKCEKGRPTWTISYKLLRAVQKVNISYTKKPSKQVQRNKVSLYWQLGLRLSDKYMINAAYNKINPPKETSESESSLASNESVTISRNSCKYNFKIKDLHDNIYVELNWPTKKNTQTPLSFNIIQTIIDHFPMNCYDQNIWCYIELKINETIYCADNNYRQGSSWYDNVKVAWKNGDNGNLIYISI